MQSTYAAGWVGSGVNHRGGQLRSRQPAERGARQLMALLPRPQITPDKAEPFAEIAEVFVPVGDKVAANEGRHHRVSHAKASGSSDARR